MKIRDKKTKYDINREAAKMSALPSGKVDKYKYLTGEEILTSDRRRIIEQVKFIYYPLGNAFEKQIKTIKDTAEKQTKTFETLNTDQQLKSFSDLFSKYFLTTEAKDEIEKNYKDGTRNQ